MNLNQFLRRYATNDNEWWKLEPGEMQNLFDEAMAEIERLRNALTRIARAYDDAENGNDPDMPDMGSWLLAVSIIAEVTLENLHDN